MGSQNKEYLLNSCHGKAFFRVLSWHTYRFDLIFEEVIFCMLNKCIDMAENESCKLSPVKSKDYQSLNLLNTNENLNVDPEAIPQKRIKVPRHVVHCSDGVYE